MFECFCCEENLGYTSVMLVWVPRLNASVMKRIHVRSLCLSASVVKRIKNPCEDHVSDLTNPMFECFCCEENLHAIVSA